VISAPALRLVQPVKGLLAAAILCQALASASSIVPIIALVQFAGLWLLGGPLQQATGPILFAIGSAIAGVLLGVSATWLSHRADTIVQLDLQRRLVDQFTLMPLGWFTEHGAGRLKKIVHDDVGAIHYLVAHTALDVTTVVATPLAGLAYLATQDWRLALTALVPLGAGIAFFVRAMRGSQANFATYARAQGDINAAIVDYVQGIAVVKTFGSAHSAQESFARAADAFHDFFRGWSRSTAAVTTASWLVVAPAVTLTMFAAVAALFTLTGWSTPQAVIALALTGPAIAAPVAVVGPRLQAIRTGRSAAAAITAVLDTPAMPWGEGTRVPANAGVQFDDVTFGYRPGTPVIENVSADLPKGSLTALVGPSGAGKSTLAALLARFHDPDRGTIRIGGVDIRELSTRQLYAQVSFVFQDVVLLEQSVRDNLATGAAVTEEAMVEAARAANIHERVIAMRHGYDTVIGHGVELSGGEAQRLSIARALLRNTPIVVLDEPTAAADPQTQAAVQSALSALIRGRTVIVIAHRLSTITGADQILVMDHGHITERGTHQQLLDADGRYARMWAAQSLPEGTRR
jgi:ATP-binding cassette subfamily B protein